MTLTDLARRATASDSGAGADAASGSAGTARDLDPVPVAGTDAAASRSTGREADGPAVASFVLGLVGLLVFNLLLGPTAIVMALLALARRTRRRGRALLGLALGVADLVVLAVLVTGNGTIAWNFGG